MTTNRLGPQLRGLSHAEAAHRLTEYGPNALPEGARAGLWQRLIRQFKSALIYILLLALILDLVLWVHEGAKTAPFEAIAIALILVLNAGFGAYQEGKAEEALARLKALGMPLVWAMRECSLAQIPIGELVPGDIVRIEAGDRVPADGLLARGHGVMADESILTGESLPIDKDLQCELFSGTLIVRSQGYMEITRTGPQSTMGRLATMLGGIEAGETPLERRLREFGNQVAIAILAVGLALTVGGLLIEGLGHLGRVDLFSVALAVAAVPEGLPAVLTLTLAMGVERLAKHKAIVRRLSAVEALGSVTVIATDKTGTLTENRMHVRALDAPDPEHALRAMVLANDAELATGAGDPGLAMAFLLGLKDPDGGTFLLPLTAVQLLWINVVADGPPALALAFDRNPGVMSRPPRPPSSKLLDQVSLRFIAISGTSKAAGGIVLLGAIPQLGYSLDEARTALFLYEFVLQLVFAYPSRRISLIPMPNIGLHLAIGLGVALQVMTVLLPPLMTLLGLVSISAVVLGAVIVAALLTWAVAEFLGHEAPSSPDLPGGA